MHFEYYSDSYHHILMVSVIPLRTEEDAREENPQGSRPRIPSGESSFPLGVLAVQTRRNPRGKKLEA